MPRLNFVFCAALLAISNLVAAAPRDSSSITPPTEKTVDLGYGKYRGSTNGYGISEFLGMRFAAPPLGDLRFRAPRDPLPENGTVGADAYGSTCLPVKDALGAGNQSSEDCLFINVFAPVTTTPSSRLPVVLYIQGGAYNTNFNANYNGSSLIKAGNNDMIVVNFNYRVGPYGFLASEEIRKDGDLNVGLLDQRKAMEWTKKHISAFGGDPNHVFIMGDSSGGGSVLNHLAAYDGKNANLFVGAIASSSYLTHVLPVLELEFQYQDLLHATNCSDITCLRNIPVEQLQAANIVRPYPRAAGVPIFPYAPCVDGTFFTRHPVSQIKTGRFVSVPLLIGNTKNEGTIFGLEANTSSQMSMILHNQYPELSSQNLSTINNLYPFNAAAQNPNHTPFFASASAAYGDGFFTCPASSVARFISSKGTKVWKYRYDVRDPANIAAGLGVPHTWEIDAVWGPGFASNEKGSDSYAGQDASIVPLVQGYWSSFIRTLSPNTGRVEGAPVWESLEGGEWLLIRTNATNMEGQSCEEERKCAFWGEIGLFVLDQ